MASLLLALLVCSPFFSHVWHHVFMLNMTFGKLSCLYLDKLPFDGKTNGVSSFLCVFFFGCLLWHLFPSVKRICWTKVQIESASTWEFRQPSWHVCIKARHCWISVVLCSRKRSGMLVWVTSGWKHTIVFRYKAPSRWDIDQSTRRSVCIRIKYCWRVWECGYEDMLCCHTQMCQTEVMWFLTQVKPPACLSLPSTDCVRSLHFEQ